MNQTIKEKKKEGSSVEICWRFLLLVFKSKLCTYIHSSSSKLLMHWHLLVAWISLSGSIYTVEISKDHKSEFASPILESWLLNISEHIYQDPNEPKEDFHKPSSAVVKTRNWYSEQTDWLHHFFFPLQSFGFTHLGVFEQI